MPEKYTPPDYARDEAEALEATDRKENQRLYGHDETPTVIKGKPQTLADLIKGDFANIWQRSATKEAREWRERREA